MIESLPLVAVLAIVAFTVERDGGFATTVWYPLAFLLLGFAVTICVSAGHVLTTTARVSSAAVVCLAVFTAWSYGTIAWAAVRDAALDGSNKGFLYFLAFGLLAAWPLSAGAVWPVVLGFGAVVGFEGVLAVEQASRASDLSQFMIGSRLSEPLGYPNASGALFMIVAWLMVGLASRRWIPVPARGIAVGLAGLNAMLNLLTESRGSIFTLPLVAIAFFVVVPGRLRSVAAVVLVAAGSTPAFVQILSVYGTGESELRHALRQSINIALVWVAVLTILGWLYAAIDQRLVPSPKLTKALTVLTTGAVAIALIGGLVAFQPWHRIDTAWHSFKYASEPSGNTSHFGGLGSNRYDFWRVGLIEFEHHPVQGIGTDNFLVPYLQLRRSGEEPAFPHSLAVRLLSQEGAVGTALFVLFIGLAGGCIFRIPPGQERDLAGILLGGAAVWLLHGLVDWLWEMPTLGVLGMALLGTACGLAPRRPSQSLPWRRWRVPLAAVGGLTVVAVSAALLLPWFANRDVQRGAAIWQADPSAAFTALDNAHRLNPLSDNADVVAGAIASHLHRYDLMRTRFQRAVDRTPEDWYANFELGIAASLTGHGDLAGVSLNKADRLYPGSPIVEATLARYRAGRRIDSDAVDRAFARQTE